MFSLRTLVYTTLEGLHRSHTTNSYLKRLKFCASLVKLDKELILGYIDQEQWIDRIRNIFCSFIYYEDVMPKEEREAFRAILVERSLIGELNKVRQERT